MGTYTTNYQLYIPTVGETGWGELVNENFTTIDIVMKELDTRIGMLEPLSVIHVDENQNITFPTKVTATEFVGGVGNFESGLISTRLDVNGFVATSIFKYTGNIGFTGDEIVASIPQISGTMPTLQFPSNRIIMGRIPFPRYAHLINIENAVYPDTVDITLTFSMNTTFLTETVGRIYKDNIEYGTITIPARAASGTSIITMPYWDNSEWSVGYVSGNVQSGIDVVVNSSIVSLYKV